MRSLVFSCILTTLLPLFPARATVLQKFDIDQLIDGAELVFTGTVLSKETVWNSEHTDIYTFAIFGDLDVLKGELEPGATTFVLRYSGGEIDGFVAGVAGAPEFSVGERRLLFIQGHLRTLFPVLGLRQGAFKILRDPATGEEKIFSGTSRREVLDFSGPDVQLREPPAEPEDRAGASAGEEDDPKAKAARLRIRDERRQARQALRGKTGRSAAELLQTLKARIGGRKAKSPKPRRMRSADKSLDNGPLR